jgi:hypothetical protein
MNAYSCEIRNALTAEQSPNRRALLRTSLQKAKVAEKGGDDLGSPVPFLRGRLSYVHASPPTAIEPLLPSFHILSALPEVAGGPVSRGSIFPHLHHLNGPTRKQRRVEQSLYGSCFKSECEFRVELLLPQSEIANFEYPNMFPSPLRLPRLFWLSRLATPHSRHPRSSPSTFNLG